MNRISFGASRPWKWKPLAKLIMLISRKLYSHVFVTWKCKAIGRRKVFEAIGSGVRILSNVTFKKEAEVVHIHYTHVTDEKLIEIEQLAHDMAGTDYGYIALVGLGIDKLVNLCLKAFGIKKTITNPFTDGNESNVCIELAARIVFCILEQPVPDDIESYDLDKYENLLDKHFPKYPQEKIDRINGKAG